MIARDRFSRQLNSINLMESSDAIYRIKKRRYNTNNSNDPDVIYGVKSEVRVNQRRSKRKTHIELRLHHEDVFNLAMAKMVAIVDLYENEFYGFATSFDREYIQIPGQQPFSKITMHKYSHYTSTALDDIWDIIQMERWINIWLVDVSSASLLDDIQSTDQPISEIEDGNPSVEKRVRKNTTTSNNPNPEYENTGSKAYDSGTSSFDQHSSSKKQIEGNDIYYKSGNEHKRPKSRARID